MSELNMEEKIVVKNLAGWDVGFTKKDGSFAGDITIPANGTLRLTRSEFIAQSQYGNKLINGIDGKGSHATVYTDDKATKIELSFETEDGKSSQQILTESKVKEMFDTKSIKTFEKQLNDAVITRAEKYALVELIKKLKLNDFEKIRMAEQHTGFKI